jgi:hypothetical protein
MDRWTDGPMRPWTRQGSTFMLTLRRIGVPLRVDTDGSRTSRTVGFSEGVLMIRENGNEASFAGARTRR